MNINEQFNKALENASRFSGTFVARVTQSWKLTIAAAVVLLGASIGFLVFALQDHEPRPSGEAPLTEAPTSTRNLLERDLDGVLVDASSTRLLPYAVMVENSSDAWPLQGPAKANLVFEAPVEGSITRFMLVFDASSTIPEVGPVRSARPYFVDWADGLDAMYVHVGGSPDALTRIASTNGFRDLNEFSNGWAFWRTATRAAPHNIYTRTDLMNQAAMRKEFTPGSFNVWTYLDPPTSTEPGTETEKPEVERITVPYEGIYAVEWRYDQEKDDYVRYRRGSMVKDADGSVVRVKNVVVILTDGQVLDDVGRLRIRTTGRGSALVFTGGGKRQASWVRSTGGHIRFEGVDGSDVAFGRGTTWISVLISADAFGKVSS